MFTTNYLHGRTGCPFEKSQLLHQRFPKSKASSIDCFWWNRRLRCLTLRSVLLDLRIVRKRIFCFAPNVLHHRSMRINSQGRFNWRSSAEVWASALNWIYSTLGENLFFCIGSQRFHRKTFCSRRINLNCFVVDVSSMLRNRCTECLMFHGVLLCGTRIYGCIFLPNCLLYGRLQFSLAAESPASWRLYLLKVCCYLLNVQNFAGRIVLKDGIRWFRICFCRIIFF